VSLQDLQAMWASVGTRNDPTGHVANPPQLEAMNVDQAGLRINSFRGDITNSVSIGSAGSQLVLRMEAPQYMLTNQNWDCHAGDLGTYSASLSEDKQTLTLASVTDACTTRAAILAGGWTRWSCPQESSDGYSQYAYCSHVSELAPGRYVSPVFKPFAAVGGQLAYTVPAGWAKLSPPPTWPDAGSASRVWLTRVDAPDRQEISIFSNVGVSGGGCAGPFAPNRPASSAADYLASLPYLSVFGRAPVEIGGLTGVQIDLSVVEGSVVQCTDPEGQVDYSTDIEIFASDDDAIILGPRDGNFARFIVLNSTDGSVVIEVSAPDQLTLDARVAEAMPVIHSFEFIR